MTKVKFLILVGVSMTTLMSHAQYPNHTISLGAAKEDVVIDHPYSFGVPFLVNLDTCVYIGETRATYLTDFVVQEFRGDSLALGKQPWRELPAKTDIQVGHYYRLIPKVKENTWTIFSSEMFSPGVTEIDLSSNQSASAIQAGWNGINNPFNSEATAELQNVRYITRYHNEYLTYSTHPLRGTTFNEGEPLLVQTPSAATMVFEDNTGGWDAPQRGMSASDTTQYVITLHKNQDTYHDSLFVDFAEKIQDAYSIGNDLKKWRDPASTKALIWTNNYLTELSATQVDTSFTTHEMILGMQIPENGTYTLAVTGEGYTITLSLDHNEIMPIEDGEWALQLQKGEVSGYVLTFKKEQKGTSVTAASAAPKTRKILHNGQLLLLQGANAYSILGTLIDRQ